MADPLARLAQQSIVIAGFGVEGRDVYRFLRGRFPDKDLGIAEARSFGSLDPEQRALLDGDQCDRGVVGGPS